MDLSETEQNIIETLRAKVKATDASASDLALVMESDYEEKKQKVEDLRAEKEDLEDEVESLEEKIEEMQEEVDEAKEAYAEPLADEVVFDADDLVDKYDLSTLREKHEAAVESEETDVDELGGTPDPSSGDDPDDDDGPSGSGGSDLSDEWEDEREVWNTRAEKYEEAGMDQAASHAESVVEALDDGNVEKAEELISE